MKIGGIMVNVFDYLYWRGDLEFNVVPFNEIDNLIMSRLSYFPIEKITELKSFTIKQLFSECSKPDFDKSIFIMKDDLKLLETIANSKRYAEIKIDNFVQQIDFELEQQFGALVVVLPNNYIYVSYRGTDNTFVGWKEDFNLTFLDSIPSQSMALSYLKKLKINIFTKIILGGHSKGGNLAVYAAMNCSDKIKKQIVAIYNNDGPGFMENIINSDKYKSINERIITIIPQTSIVGKLLNYNGAHKVVQSTQKLIMQHDLYSWQIEVDHLLYADDIDENSKKICKTINEWLAKTPFDQREKFFEIIYNVLNSTNAVTFPEFEKNLYGNLKTMYDSYKNVSPEDKELITKLIEFFLKSIKDNFIPKVSIPSFPFMRKN
ncbi:MAG: Mbeg1-like protein [Clostridia bacterium]